MTQKILIVEDDPAIVVSLEFLISQNGFEVQTAANGEEGEALARTFGPDLILLDVNMPLKSGFEVCQQLRSESAFDTTRIVLLTAKGRDVDVEKGLALGADAYITKPFSTRELIPKLQSILEQPRNSES
ncbi:MAG: response regulator transcription factor [bacterium]|jgi:DNA-binding response OmpR family regulator